MRQAEAVRRALLGLAAFAAFLLTPAHGAAREPLTVFAASSLADVLAEAAEHDAREGPPLLISFASSAALARQIAAGAPADLYISAHPAWTDYLLERSALAPHTVRPVAGNRLALVARQGATSAQHGASDPLRMLARDDLWLAMGEPGSVPAGRYARQALEALGVWQDMQGRLAFAADARAVLALVERGQAELGIVYRSDALASARVETVVELDDSLHEPILYLAGAVAGGHVAGAERFIAFLCSPAGQAVLARHGFTPAP